MILAEAPMSQQILNTVLGAISTGIAGYVLACIRSKRKWQQEEYKVKPLQSAAEWVSRIRYVLRLPLDLREPLVRDVESEYCSVEMALSIAIHKRALPEEARERASEIFRMFHGLHADQPYNQTVEARLNTMTHEYRNWLFSRYL